jgi:hypothetical protein
MKRFLLIAALLWATSLSVGAMAAEPSADALIEQGLGLRREGKPEQALELFRQAHAIAPSSRTFGQMGLVETSLKQWVDAENHLSLSLANPDDRWVAKNRAFLDEALGSCRRHVGDLVVSGPAGAEVFVGGQSVGTLPAVPALRLAEGTVTVSASAPGSKPFEKAVSIRPGARSVVAVTLEPVITPVVAPGTPAPTSAPLATPTAPAPRIVTIPPTHGESSPSSSHTWAGVSLAVAGAAALGWGIYWIAIDGNPHGAKAPDNMQPVYDTGIPGLVLSGAGTAAIIGGAALLFLTGRHQTTPVVAVGLTPSSLIVHGNF